MLKYAFALIVAVALSACSTPAQVNAMIGAPSVMMPANSPLKSSLQVNAVAGGQSTNPLWTSQVGNPEFQQALQQSLMIQGMISSGNAKYLLDAVLVELKQPFAGFDLSVTSTVRYTLREAGTNRVAFDQTVTAEYTAKVSDSLLAVERLRLANEGSIKSNISKFMDQMITSVGSGSGLMSSLKLGRIS